MSPPQLFVACVIESIQHTLSIEAASIEEATALMSDPNNPCITLVEKTSLELRIADIRPLHSNGGVDDHHKGA